MSEKNQNEPGGSPRTLHDGRDDGFTPLKPLDPAETESCDALLEAMASTAFAGRGLGEAASIVHDMTVDEDCRVVLTVSGAMTVAKMGLVMVRMIERGMVDAIVSTGALMAHGLTEAIGAVHYRRPEGVSDEELFAKGYNRVYDTLEMESNLNDVERVVHAALESLPKGETFSSEQLCRAIGKVLSERDEGPGVLRAAYEHDVPVYVPAFTDSEIGLDVATWAVRAGPEAGDGDELDPFARTPAFNPFGDLVSFCQWARAAPRLGIFTIGGGVPRNWSQQVGPYVDLLNHRLGLSLGSPRYRYAVRICPEPVHWGGLSGCTYSEGVSWGKFVPPAEGGRFAEVHADATLAWPLLVRGVIERLDRHDTD
ncbi:MAG: deoxyhypusine synthase family protein [Acidobacteriota bacterium]